MGNSDESDSGDDMLDMVEDDDLEFLKNAVHQQSYNILNQVKHVRGATNAKRRKIQNEETLENTYEEQLTEPENVKNLLPIKTKKGIITRTAPKVDKLDHNDKAVISNSDNNKANDDDDEIEDEYFFDGEEETSTPKSSADLLARYNESLRNKKVHIGYLCASLLENPEEKVKNFQILLKMLDDEVLEASLSIKKLIVVSMLEVFKDIIPSYQIKHQDLEGVKLKKDTLKLHKYEQALLQYYKKYLQKLEKFLGVLIKKKGDTRKKSEEELKLGELSVHAMCDLLVAHPYFNFSPNIVQAVIPFLNHSDFKIRQIVSLACKSVFKDDKKEEITLKILRVINHYLKNKAHNVKTDMLEVLLHLKIKEANLDQEAENKIKQKKIMSHKQNVLQLSKKERKRKKRLQELEKELLETKAEENKQIKQKNLTEITKMVFGIYFRILKSSTNTKALGVCLEGLAKFSHCINFDYYVDLINVLNKLLNEEWLGYREQLYCIQTVFAILHDQTDSINLDPTRIYICLYSHLLETHASKTYKNCPILLKILSDVLIKKRKKITNKRTLGFTKRLSTLSLQLLHNGTLGMLAIIKQILMLNKSIDILLDLDSTVGNGDYQAELNDPEYCNASSAALYELRLLNRHYHPVVCKFSKYIAHGSPSTGEGSLPPEYNKCTPEQLFTDFDTSTMCFNPAVKVPKTNQSKFKRKRIRFADTNFKEYCDKVVKQSKSGLFL